MTENSSAPPEDFRSLYIFGRDVSQIPCFRSSLLYGISTGAAVGIGSFFRTSRPQRSVHIGFGTFFVVTLGYWFACRYNYSKKKFEMMKLQSALQKHALYEGTELEKEINRRSDSV